MGSLASLETLNLDVPSACLRSAAISSSSLFATACNSVCVGGSLTVRPSWATPLLLALVPPMALFRSMLLTSPVGPCGPCGPSLPGIPCGPEVVPLAEMDAMDEVDTLDAALCGMCCSCPSRPSSPLLLATALIHASTTSAVVQRRATSSARTLRAVGRVSVRARAVA